MKIRGEVINMNNEMKKVENNLDNDILDTLIGAMIGSPDNICVNDTNNTKFDFSDLDLDLSDFYKIGVFDRDSDFDSKKYMENEILPLMLKRLNTVLMRLQVANHLKNSM